MHRNFRRLRPFSLKTAWLPAASPLTMARRSPLSTVKACAKNGDVVGIHYRLFRGCAIAFLEKPAAFSARDLVYCDPPYLMETRSGRRLYEYEMSRRRPSPFAAMPSGSCPVWS